MYRVEADIDGHGTLETNIDGRDIRRWESETGKSFLVEDFSYSMLSELARLALARNGVLVMSAGEFNEACSMVREVREQLDPTPPTPTDES